MRYFISVLISIGNPPQVGKIKLDFLVKNQYFLFSRYGYSIVNTHSLKFGFLSGNFLILDILVTPLYKYFMLFTNKIVNTQTHTKIYLVIIGLLLIILHYICKVNE